MKTWVMFLPPLDFALVELSITWFCMCEGQTQVRKGAGTDHCVVQHFDVSTSIWVLPKAGASCWSLSHWSESVMLTKTWRKGEAEANYLPHFT